MRLHNILLSIGLMAVLVSCEKELDISYHNIDPLPVIEAELTPDGARVGITMTTPMGEPMDRTRLTDAVVTLTDLTDGATYDLHADADGYFVNTTSGIAGHDYRLTVERKDCRYEAMATMYPATQIESIEFNWIKMPYDYVAVFQGRFYDNSAYDGDCYWIKLYRNGEIYMWGETDDRGVVDGICTVATMTTRRDTDEEDEEDVLYDGDVITFTVMQISGEMHDYLEALQNNSNGPAMFSGDRCLGYFMASSPVSDYMEFHPDEIPEYGRSKK